MTTLEIDSLLARRFLSLQSPVKRWKLSGYILLKSLAWRWLTGGTLHAKRTFDIIAGSLLLLLSSPLWLFVALLLKLEDGGPVLFYQTRVGKRGRRFRMFKFRSMYVNAEQRLHEFLGRNESKAGVIFKMKNDPRVTRVGKWLRRASLDELPQLLNVVRGEMSLVGPRPPLPREVAMYSAGDRRRLMATPGLTCLWQISGRSDIDFSGQVRLDVQYIERRTFWNDLKILLKTIPAVLSGRGAY